MPYDLQIIRSSDFLRIDAHGRPDLATSQRILAELASAMLKRGLSRALMDLRDVGPQALTTTEIFKLASMFHESGFQMHHRLAILHRQNRIENADFFAMCVSQRGWNVRAFDSFEDAFDWLALTEPADRAEDSSPKQ